MKHSIARILVFWVLAFLYPACGQDNSTSRQMSCTTDSDCETGFRCDDEVCIRADCSTDDAPDCSESDESPPLDGMVGGDSSAPDEALGPLMMVCADEAQAASYSSGPDIALTVCFVQFLDDNTEPLSKDAFEAELLAAEAYYREAGVYFTNMFVDDVSSAKEYQLNPADKQINILLSGVHQLVNSKHPRLCHIAIGIVNEIVAGEK